MFKFEELRIRMKSGLEIVSKDVSTILRSGCQKRMEFEGDVVAALAVPLAVLQ
jgi:hypothetical protein